MQACSQCNGSGGQNCPTIGSDGSGVSNADFVLYVSAVNATNGCTGNTIAFAGACQMEAQYDRYYMLGISCFSSETTILTVI